MHGDVIANIGGVGDLPRHNRARCHTACAGLHRIGVLDRFQFLGRPTVMRGEMDQRAIEPKNRAAHGSAKSCGPRGDRIEGWSQISRRRGNDPKNFSRCRPLGQRFVALCIRQGKLLLKADNGPLKIGNDPLRIGQRAIRRRVLLTHPSDRPPWSIIR